MANDTRKAIPDPQGRFVVKSSDGTCSATHNSMLPALPMDEIKLGVGTSKIDDKLPKKKMYSDVVMIGKNDDWVLNQWVSQDVIMEPVPNTVRGSVMSGGSQSAKRKIGVHFARFGFPAKSFAAIFHTLDSSMKGLLDSVVQTEGYYWANASWGVNQSPGTFVYLTENNTRAETTHLSEAMDMMQTKSSMGVGTFAISVACGYEKQGDKVIPNSAKLEFSIKCHSFIHFELTDYHGPPQNSAIGMMVSNDFMSQAKPLSKPKALSTVMNTTSNLFGGAAASASGHGGMNPFAPMGQQGFAAGDNKGGSNNLL